MAIVNVLCCMLMSLALRLWWPVCCHCATFSLFLFSVFKFLLHFICCVLNSLSHRTVIGVSDPLSTGSTQIWLLVIWFSRDWKMSVSSPLLTHLQECCMSVLCLCGLLAKLLCLCTSPNIRLFVHLVCRTSHHRPSASATWRGSSTSWLGAWAWLCWWPSLNSATSHATRPRKWRWRSSHNITTPSHHCQNNNPHPSPSPQPNHLTKCSQSFTEQGSDGEADKM